MMATHLYVKYVMITVCRLFDDEGGEDEEDEFIN